MYLVLLLSHECVPENILYSYKVNCVCKYPGQRCLKMLLGMLLSKINKQKSSNSSPAHLLTRVVFHVSVQKVSVNITVFWDMLAGKYYPGCKNERNQCKTRSQTQIHQEGKTVFLLPTQGCLLHVCIYMCVYIYIGRRRCASFSPRGKGCTLPVLLDKSGWERRSWDSLSSCGASGCWRQL